MRWVGHIVENTIDCLHEILFALGGNHTACVGVAIKAWKVGARDLQPDTVSGFKNLRSCANDDVQFVYPIALHQQRFRQRFAIAGAENAIGD